MGQREAAFGRDKRRIWLWVLAITAPLVGALVLQAFGFVSALPLAPQLSAPAPFGTFHDLRWVWTFAWSWPSVAWQLAALLVFRSLFDACVIAAAWPQDVQRPGFACLWRRSALYVLIAIVVMSPWAALSFAAGVTSYGWFMIATMFASLLMALVMPQGVITGEWWRRILPWRTLPHVIAAWLTLMLAALAITFSPPWVTVLIAAVAGALNALLWRRIVATVVAARAPRHTIPLAPLAILAILGVVIAGGGYLLGTSGQNEGNRPGASARELAASGSDVAFDSPPILFVGGFTSAYNGGRFQLFGRGWLIRRYSYNGLAPNGRPLPYKPGDTFQSLAKSAQLLARQIEHLYRQSGRPVTVIAESEGTMVARIYFATHASPPVKRYIQVSPLMRPSRVYYPPAGRSGSGLIAGWELRGMLALVRLESPSIDYQADMPFLRSMVGQAPLLRDQTLCPIPGVKTFMFIPLEAAMMAQRGRLSRIPWATLPGWHASLLRRGTVQRDIRHLLKTGELRQRPGWTFAFELIRGLAAAWQSPALPLRLPPWRAPPGSDPAFGGRRCGP